MLFFSYSSFLFCFQSVLDGFFVSNISRWHSPQEMVGPVPGAVPVGQPVTAWRPGSLEATLGSIHLRLKEQRLESAGCPWGWGSMDTGAPHTWGREEG